MIIFFTLLLALSVHAAYEGESCVHNGQRGVCMTVDNCASALADIRDKKPITQCGFVRLVPIVCCVTSAASPVLTTTERSSISTTEYMPPVYDYVEVAPRAPSGCAPLPTTLTAAKNGNIAWDKCIEYQERLVFPCERSVILMEDMSRVNHCHHNADELIVGGVAATEKEFPHMALLGFGADVDNIEWLCGGSLISERFVLTAGHCTATRDLPVSYVALGRHNRTDDPTGTRRYRVKTIHRHPLYEPPKKYHDIALLELDRTVDLNEAIVPACLDTGERDDQRASATGWGLTQDKGETSNVLQKVVLEKFDELECLLSYGPTRLMSQGFDRDTQICYGDRNKPKDTCQGDSGGPLQVKSKKIACMYVVVGVTSFGRGCGYVGQPGIYTKVHQYLDWIVGIVWP